MGLGKAIRRVWRYFHPQYHAMSKHEIAAMDRAVAASMATGTFGTRPRQPGASGTDGGRRGGNGPTGDQLWQEAVEERDTEARAVVSPSAPGGEEVGGGPGPSPGHLWSMGSSHQSGGRASASSSWGRDSGYGEQQWSSSRRPYGPKQGQQHYPQRPQEDPYWNAQYEQYQPYEYDEYDGYHAGYEEGDYEPQQRQYEEEQAYYYERQQAGSPGWQHQHMYGPAEEEYMPQRSTPVR